MSIKQYTNKNNNIYHLSQIGWTSHSMPDFFKGTVFILDKHRVSIPEKNLFAIIKYRIIMDKRQTTGQLIDNPNTVKKWRSIINKTSAKLTHGLPGLIKERLYFVFFSFNLRYGII